MVRAENAIEAAKFYFEEWEVDDTLQAAGAWWIRMTRTTAGMHMEQHLQVIEMSPGEWQVLVQQVPEPQVIIS